MAPRTPDAEKHLTPQQRTGIGQPTRLTWELFQKICAQLRKTGARFKSCELFGLGGNYVQKRIKELAQPGPNQDTAWQELWDQSLELYADDLEIEMHRRVVHGTDKPVFYKGVPVGNIREYSDNLALALAKAARPERFRENLKVDASVSGGVLLLPPKMTPEEFMKLHSSGETDREDG